MLNPFQFLRQQVAPHYLGIDIGTTSIKIAEVDQGNQSPRLVNYALLESQNSLTRANVAFQTSTLKLFDDEVTGFLKSMLLKMKPKTQDVVASLPSFAAFTTVLNFPAMTDSELQKSIAIQAKQYVPLPISEVALDPIKVGSFEDEKGNRFDQILLVSVPLEQIKKFQKVFKDAGLRLKILEIEGLSMTRALIGTDPTPTFIVDIGSRSTSIIAAEKGQMKFVAQTDYAGSSLTQALSSSLSINPLRAEELKRERGVAGTGPNYELSTIMLPFLDVILNEVKRARFNYESQFPASPKIERVILSGGGANLIGIEKYASAQLEVPAVKASPLSKFEYDPILEPFIPELNPMLGVSLGLALREF